MASDPLLFAGFERQPRPRLYKIQGVRSAPAGAREHEAFPLERLVRLLPPRPTYHHPENLTNRLAKCGTTDGHWFLSFWDWLSPPDRYMPVVWLEDVREQPPVDLFKYLKSRLVGAFPRFRHPRVRPWQPPPPPPKPEPLRGRRRGPRPRHLRLLDNPPDT